MEQSPRTFTHKDIQSLEIIARWSMSEFERQWLFNIKSNPEIIKQHPAIPSSPSASINPGFIHKINFK